MSTGPVHHPLHLRLWGPRTNLHTKQHKATAMQRLGMKGPGNLLGRSRDACCTAGALLLWRMQLTLCQPAVQDPDDVALRQSTCWDNSMALAAWLQCCWACHTAKICQSLWASRPCLLTLRHDCTVSLSFSDGGPGGSEARRGDTTGKRPTNHERTRVPKRRVARM